MSRRIITEQEIRECIRAGKKTFDLPSGAILTALASDIAAIEGIEVREMGKQDLSKDTILTPKPAAADSLTSGGMIAFGSDHGGYQFKEALKKYAQSMGYKTLDVGTNNEEPCDYPDFAYAVAIAVSSGKAWRGVMIDGAGIGSCVVANKVSGVRAACCHNEFVARNAREHNDTNVLTLGSRVTGIEVCKEILRVWLESWFSGGRHKSRVDKIMDVEARFKK